MAPTAMKRRNVESEVRRPKKKIKNFKKQKAYHSSSEDEDEGKDHKRRPRIPRDAMRISEATDKGGITKPTQPVEEVEQPTPGEPVVHAESEDEESAADEEPDELQINTVLNMEPGDEDESEDDDEDEGVQVEDLDDLEEEGDEDDDLIDEFDSDGPSETGPSRKKRNDPSAFATSISKILTTKLSTQKRVDPILSRSKTADEANKALAEEKLDTKARASIRAEKRSLLERGRVRDVLGLDAPGIDTGAIIEEEKRLKKTAQRGVVKLFNAVRAAQVKAEEAEKAARDSGLVGIAKREERINEMSKEGFLDLISRGGKSAAVES